MSASYLVDAANTLDAKASINLGSGASFTVGEILDLGYANTFTNVVVAGGVGSGPIEIRAQTSDATTSGSFTDPTSGLAALPVNCVSGGVWFANSGLWASGVSSPFPAVSGAPLFCSGAIQFVGGFQSPHRYVRLINNSGVFPVWFTAGVVKQKKVTGSGTGGWTYSPTSGTINV